MPNRTLITLVEILPGWLLRNSCQIIRKIPSENAAIQTPGGASFAGRVLRAVEQVQRRHEGIGCCHKSEAADFKDEAMYWKSEIYFRTRDYEKAREIYSTCFPYSLNLLTRLM